MCGAESIAPVILNLGARWRFAVNLMPGRFIPRIKPPGVYFIGCRAGPRAGLDDMEKKSHRKLKKKM